MALERAAARGAITDVAGIKVGHFTDQRRPTGCTAILAEAGAVAGVDVRGSAPGTRETSLLDPINTIERIHAVLLAGGSAFGLEAASGVVRALEESGIGHDARFARVPIVPAAILFDLSLGDPRIRPDAEAGYRAARAASAEAPAEGNVGAGAGATVGKLFGLERAMKGGLGTSSITLPSGLTVGALVAVNAIGDIVDPATGQLVAGARSADGRRLLGAMAAVRRGERLPPLLGGASTTIGVIATDAPLTKAQATKIAQMAHDGLARSINPVHTTSDGDTLFALAPSPATTQTSSGLVTLIGALAAESVAEAVLRAVRNARSLPGLPAAADLER
jgi:L-aminopeptidase/D-esterase-like protein